MREHYTETDIDTGLTAAQVSERIESGLINERGEQQGKTAGRIVLDNVFTFFNLINVILAALLLSVGSYENMLFMMVVLSNTAIGIFQELRAKRTLDKLSLIAESGVKALRDGAETKITLDEIVKDDILIFSAGNQVCADSILRDGMLEMNESLLTGESDTVLKNPGDTLLSGSYVVSGHALVQVLNVGADNYAQKITSEAKKRKKRPSELRSAMDKILKFVSIPIIPMGIGLYITQIYGIGESRHEATVNTVGAIIGMIPEGLILLTSIALAVGALNLARRGALVHELFCIETLARVDVLCVDKTGTITEGNMRVQDVSTLEDIALDEIMGNMVSALKDDNSTFLALKDYFKLRENYRADMRIPFSSARKYSGVSFSGRGTYMLGAFESLFPDGSFEEVRERLRVYTNEGIRVITLAHSPEKPGGLSLPDGLRPCALIFISDVLREGVRETLEYFDAQDVRLTVISGDHPATAAYIAASAGMAEAYKYVDATTLGDFRDICEAVEEYRVFGRVTPERKKEIVKALQANGHTVAMTGDGVNDVPALKQANCGIAMASGSDAAKNCSDMVLLNSDFATIPHAVREGRRVINNIQSSASLFLVKTLFSFILTLLTLLFQQSYPFIPLHLTLISSFAVGLPTFILSMEPNYNRVKAGFLKHVAHNALTGAVTVLFLVNIITLLTVPLGLDDVGRSTMCVLAAGVASLYMIRQVFPLTTLLRRIVFYGMYALFFAGILAVQSIIHAARETASFADLPFTAMLLLIILILATPALIACSNRALSGIAVLWRHMMTHRRR